MDYELAFLSEMSLTEWARYIYDLLHKRMGLEVKYKEHQDYIGIGCEYLYIIIDTDEMIGLDVLQEDFSFEANISIRIQMFERTLDQGIEIIFQMLSLIISDRAENFILLENGSEVVLMKKNDDICTHIHKGYETDYPFRLLGEDVKEM